jgi:hypothetical protein
MALTAGMPVPGARLAALAVGFFVGASTAIAAKKVVNEAKDAAVDAVSKATDRTERMNMPCSSPTADTIECSPRPSFRHEYAILRRLRGYRNSPYHPYHLAF